jgi:hypothetical protein
MDATELRIGNWYQYASEMGISYNAVQEISRNKFGLLSDIYGTNFEICKPINLTEEWFEKFDFDKTIVEEYPIFQKDFLTIEFYSDKSIVYFGGLDVARTTIKYVHQLQNLYFALCGKELILKI